MHMHKSADSITHSEKGFSALHEVLLPRCVVHMQMRVHEEELLWLDERVRLLVKLYAVPKGAA